MMPAAVNVNVKIYKSVVVAAAPDSRSAGAVTAVSGGAGMLLLSPPGNFATD